MGLPNAKNPSPIIARSRLPLVWRKDPCEKFVLGLVDLTPNPLAISVGFEVIKIIHEKGFLEKVDNNARYLWNKLKEFEKKFNEIIEVRGAGFLLGIKTKSNHIEINELLQKNGLLCLTASENIIRIAPPLIIDISEIDVGLHIIEKTLADYK